MVVITKKNKEEYVSRIINGLHCSKEEAENVYEYDCKVEAGEKTEYDLTATQQKIAQKFVHTGTRKAPTAYKFTQRQRKSNATKESLVTELFNCLTNYGEFELTNLHIAEKNGKVCFKINDKWYTWALTEHVRSTPKWIKM